MPTIAAVIFDLDGVIVSTDELHYLSWLGVADEQGIYFDREINHRLRGVDRPTSLGILLERAGDRVFTPDQKQAMMDAKNDHFRQMVDKLTVEDALPNAVAMIEGLRARRIRTAVGSASRNARFIVDHLGLSDRFDAVVDGNDITRSKPDPQVFVMAADAMGVERSACVVIEDATAGIEAARAGGMFAVALGPASGHPLAHRSAQSLADLTVDDLLKLA